MNRVTNIRIGRFKILRRLGRGGMGAVYEGRDPMLDRRVAIKTLNYTVTPDKNMRSRFEREAKAAAKLQHSNIVTVYELGNFGGEEQPYIVMEYLEGKDVASLIGSRDLTILESIDITIQLCKALDYAHQNGVVHRDIKPANLRYLEDGQIKIMDFGIARVEESQQITESGVMVGSVHYMSPEQIRGEVLDGRSDIFSAGCILYELLTGVRAFNGDSPTSVLYRIINENPTPVVDKNPDVTRAIQGVIERAMAKQIKDRFPTAGSMSGELEKIVSGYRKGLPKTQPIVQKSLDELAALTKAHDWKAVIPKAKTLVDSHPQLGVARRHLRRATWGLEELEKESKWTIEDRTQHLKEISVEISALYGSRAVAQSQEINQQKLWDEKELGTIVPVVVDSDPVQVDASGQEGSPASDGKDAVRALAAPIWALVVVVIVGLVGVLAWLFVPEPPGPEEMSQIVRLHSEPKGAAIYLDGVNTGLVTNSNDDVELQISGMTGEVHVVELKLDGFEPVSSEFVLVDEPFEPMTFVLPSVKREIELVSIPSGASVSLDGKQVAGLTPLSIDLSDGEHELIISSPGYQPRTLLIEKGELLPLEPIKLTAVKQPGTFRVEAPYLVAIRMGKREMVSTSTNPSLRLQPGRYTLRLWAPDVFLNRDVDVSIREGDIVGYEAPPIGRVSVRANPGNCMVTIDGIEAGAPPFMNREVVTGSHEFVFAWPEGVIDKQDVMVQEGEPSYVIGQKPSS